MVRYRLTSPANRDLLRVTKAVALHSLVAADRLIESFADAFDLLAENPRIGRTRGELAEGLRALQVENWIIFYHVTAGDQVVIHRVLESWRDLPALFNPADE